jgi:uncharacterized sulfatase
MPEMMPGHSLLSRFSMAADKTSPPRDSVFSGRERHSSSRYSTLSYPCRCIRTQTHLYIRNFKPERWPAGAPQKYNKALYDANGSLVAGKLGDPQGGYHDIDNGPTLQWMIANRDRPHVGKLLAAAVDHRPREELYDIKADPGCLNNLAQSKHHAAVREDLAQRLSQYLTHTGDLRETDAQAANIWETYPRVSSLRWFPVPQWAQADPDSVPQLEWMEKRRPRE